MITTISNITYNIAHNAPDNSENSIHYVLASLLTGKAQIIYNNRKLNQKMDFSKIPSIQKNRLSKSSIEQFLQEYSYNGNSKRFVSETIALNRKYFQEILKDFSLYFLADSNNSHITAFAYLYRIMERIEYSSPLIYCKRNSDFIGTFNLLKGLFSEKDIGEMGFFINFLKTGALIQRDTLGLKINISFEGSLDAPKYTKTIKKIANQLVEQVDTYDKFNIKIEDMPKLIHTIRNRFFHTRTGDGQSNISSIDLGDPESFFKSINQVTSSFLGFYVLHTLTI